MISMKLAGVAPTATLIAALQVLPAAAADLFISQHGSDSANCTFLAPCQSLSRAITAANTIGNATGGTTEIGCLDGGDYSTGATITQSVTIDCVGTSASLAPISVSGSGITVTLKNYTMFGWDGSGITLTNGTLIVDNVHITKVASAIFVQPTGPSKLIVKNSTFDNNASGVLIKPIMGASVTATFDHVTIVNNSGGGLKTDTTVSGPITVDISNSTISYNAGNGLNAVSGSSGQNNMFNISHTVIAGNGSAGVQANGANSAALIDTTLLDSNVAGATSAVGGGRLLTYGNNRIVGIPGSGFTGPTPLQ